MSAGPRAVNHKEGMMVGRLSAGVALSMLVACAAPAEQAPDPSVLLDADRQFAADVAETGSEGWVSWFAADGAMIVQGVGEVSGRDAIRAAVQGLDAPGVSLTWEPQWADIADSGDLGWTRGTYTSESPGPDGEVARDEGLYVSIWRLQPDGSWKVVMDLGNPTGPPPTG